MIDVVANAKAPLDHLGHPWTGPQVGVKPSRLGTLEQQSFELGPMLGPKLQWPPRGGLCAPPCRALGASGCLPAPDAAPIHAHTPGNLDRLQSLFEQRQRAHTTMFEFFWASGRPHGVPPEHSLGHYLHRDQ